MSKSYEQYDLHAKLGCYSFIPLHLRPWGPCDKITPQSHYIEKWTIEGFIQDVFSDEHYGKKEYTSNLSYF